MNLIFCFFSEAKEMIGLMVDTIKNAITIDPTA